MTAEELIKNMAQLEVYRAPLYLNKDKMKDWYLQMVSPIIELSTNKAISGSIESGIKGFFSSQVSADKETVSSIAIDHETVQAIVAENIARSTNKLTDLSITASEKGTLSYYLGEAKTVIMFEPVTPENTSLNQDECDIIETERQKQQNGLSFFDHKVATVVLTFKSNNQAYAAVCSTESVNPNWPTSYANQNQFGLLCTEEQIISSVIFLAPIWVWHQ